MDKPDKRKSRTGQGYNFNPARRAIMAKNARKLAAMWRKDTKGHSGE